MDLDVLQEAIKGNAALAAHFETKRLSWKDLAMLDATVDIETDGSTVLENPDEPDLTKTVAVEQGKPKEVTHTVAAAGSATVPSAPAPKAKAGPKGGPKATK
ncbi:MAG: hypothetical protein JKY94_17850 [Rhodobacteraceae bacterium]|nr:hypothetical protein [Paracoccaceae bacterium]